MRWLLGAFCINDDDPIGTNQMIFILRSVAFNVSRVKCEIIIYKYYKLSVVLLNIVDASSLTKVMRYAATHVVAASRPEPHVHCCRRLASGVWVCIGDEMNVIAFRKQMSTINEIRTMPKKEWIKIHASIHSLLSPLILPSENIPI